MAKKAKKAKLTTDEAMMAGHLPYELSMILSTLSVIGPWPPALLGIQNALLAIAIGLCACGRGGDERFGARPSRPGRAGRRHADTEPAPLAAGE